MSAILLRAFLVVSLKSTSIKPLSRLASASVTRSQRLAKTTVRLPVASKQLASSWSEPRDLASLWIELTRCYSCCKGHDVGWADGLTYLWLSTNKIGFIGGAVVAVGRPNMDKERCSKSVEVKLCQLIATCWWLTFEFFLCL